jgi:hypothetical protein
MKLRGPVSVLKALSKIVAVLTLTSIRLPTSSPSTQSVDENIQMTSADRNATLGAQGACSPFPNLEM